MARSEDGRSAEGLRERKRRETFERITDASFRLFSERGYEATTLDDIAAEAGVSRRSLFNYFETKDAILFAHLGSYYEVIRRSLSLGSPGDSPLELVQKVLVSNISSFDADRVRAITKIMGHDISLQVRSRVNDTNLEQVVVDGLAAVWPDQEMRYRLRLVASLATAAMRFAVRAWLLDGAHASLSDCVDFAFEAMKREVRNEG